MIVTKDFVLINFPKTGSSFTRQCIKDIYRARFKELPLLDKIAIKLGIKPPLMREFKFKNIKFKADFREDRVDQHGTFKQIPNSYNDRDIISCSRNPIDGYVSRYNFKGWVRYPPCPKDIIDAKFPNFPDLSFEEYLELLDNCIPYRIGHELNNVDIGVLSIQFIQMYSNDPEYLLSNISNQLIDSDEVFKYFPDIRFMRQENLREDMKRVLNEFGYKKDELSLVESKGNVNVTDNKSTKVELVTDSIKEKIRYMDRLMYKVYEDRGVNYV